MENYINVKYEDKRNFRLSVILAIIVTIILTFIDLWQLIIIPGILAGLMHKKMSRGMISGALGVFIVWLFYMMIMMTTRNTYLIVDQFAGLIFGDLGYGWILIIIILLLGALFGALGGAIGSGISQLLDLKDIRDTSELKPTSKKQVAT